MVLSKRSAWRILLIVASAVAVLFSLPYRLHATEVGPDWITGQVSFNLHDDYNYTDGDQYTVLGNVLKEDAIADMNTSSFGLPNLLKQSYRVYPTSVGYFSSEYALPLGESRWQLVDGSRLRSGYFPNPASAGVLVKVSGTSAVRYVSDWRSMTSDLNASMHGAILRRFPVDFSFENSQQLVRQDGTPVPVTEVSGISYSKNGRYVYVNSLDGRMIVELPTMTYQTFAPYFRPNYSLSTAISNSGRYVVEGSKDIGLLLYDLATCDTLNNCTKKDLTDFLRSEYSKTLTNTQGLGELSVVGTKFINESSLDIYAWVTSVDFAGKYVHMQLSVDPGVQTMRYLALGDSFSSGEGAGDYYEATNYYAADDNYNECHQSRVSYSEVINTWLTPDWYDSVACSGAQMKDVTYKSLKLSDYYIHTSQAKFPVFGSNNVEIQNYTDYELLHRALNYQPGYVPQSAILQKVQPSVVTLSIGGNDIGFGDIITSCVSQLSCYYSRDERERLADLIDQRIPQLVKTYESIKQNMSGPNPRLYVLGYPSIVNQDMPCNSFLGQGERGFANDLVKYLNAAISVAAQDAGVVFVDSFDAFIDYALSQDHRICGGATSAVNGLYADLTNASDDQPLGRYFSSSYHPNELGNAMLAKRLRQYTNDFNRSMPNGTTSIDKPAASIYRMLVGDNEDKIDEYIEVNNDFIKNPTLIANDSLQIDMQLNDDTIPPKSGLVEVEIHSEPVSLGTLPVSSKLTITGTVPLPDDIAPGYHEIHLTYTDIQGKTHDIYHHILVLTSQTDFDGDGILNDDEQCVIGGTLGIDRDKDGVDDACDVDITEPQPDNTVNESVTGVEPGTRAQVINNYVAASVGSTTFSPQDVISGESQYVLNSANSLALILPTGEEGLNQTTNASKVENQSLGRINLWLSTGMMVSIIFVSVLMTRYIVRNKRRTIQ